MKTLTDLLELVNKAIEKTNKERELMISIGEVDTQTLYDVFFIDFSGHVNQVAIRYYCVYESKSKDNRIERCQGYLNNEDNIQELYWFLKNRLRG